MQTHATRVLIGVTPATKTMTIYIDDDRNASALVRETTSESTSCRILTQPPTTAGSFALS